mmetsp:Transcript_55347/g.118012  ORF Transcript_55347/g.118012 Transcript_55347/m.118012 type:complete len:235 (+) Transcript_55347:373-1077(+)
MVGGAAWVGRLGMGGVGRGRGRVAACALARAKAGEARGRLASTTRAAARVVGAGALAVGTAHRGIANEGRICEAGVMPPIIRPGHSALTSGLGGCLPDLLPVFCSSQIHIGAHRVGASADHCARLAWLAHHPVDRKRLARGGNFFQIFPEIFPGVFEVFLLGFGFLGPGGLDLQRLHRAGLLPVAKHAFVVHHQCFFHKVVEGDGGLQVGRREQHCDHLTSHLDVVVVACLFDC